MTENLTSVHGKLRDQRIVFEKTEEHFVVHGISRDLSLILRHAKRIKQRLQPIVDVSIRTEDRARRVVSMPVDMKVTLHVPESNHKGNKSRCLDNTRD